MAKKKRSPSRGAPLRTNLRSARSEAKKLDAELVRLLAERRELSRVLAELQPGLSTEQRIAADQERLAALAGGLDPQVASLLRAVLADERNASRPITVAYLGPANTFSHHAATHHFGEAAGLAPVGAIPAVFEAVERGDCQYGVVPLENSTDGRVSDTLQAFSEQRAEAPVRPQVCAEIPMRIHHCLVGLGERAGVRRVLSKPQALSQCRNWLAGHLPQAEPAPVSSTADAAGQAKADHSIAAIASERAAAAMGLAVLAKNIEDHPDNVTRFAVIARSSAPKTGRDKTALMFEAPHEPGALADAMAVFKRHKLNLTWIESFPIPGTRTEPSGGRYRFFVELEGHHTALMPRRAIAALAKKATHLAILGSYPRAEPIG